MYNEEITEIVKLVAALTDVEPEEIMDISITPGVLSVLVRDWSTGMRVVMKEDIPWQYIKTPTEGTDGEGT